MATSSQASYVVPADLDPSTPQLDTGVSFQALLTTGDQVGLKDDGVTPWRFGGIPDGLGAFDNLDGTFTVLVNHELPGNRGIVRDHGAIGSYVSALTIDKTTLEVLEGKDLIEDVHLFNPLTDSFTATAAVISRLCSADLAPVSAYYNAATGLGYNGGRIFLSGEETGSEGRLFAHFASGIQAGNSFELADHGKFSWENAVANPNSGDKTVVAGLDDSTGGQLYFYVGDKKATGSALDQAGLIGGTLFGLSVTELAATANDETSAPNPLGADESSAFTLVSLGDVESQTGVQLEQNSEAGGITSFLRPEDGQWDTINPNRFYFVTTASFTGPSRLWAVDFVDGANPQLGGTVRLLLNGTEGQKMMDNMTVDNRGHVIIQEDVGNNSFLSRVLNYDPATDTLTTIGTHDPARFLTGAPNFLTQDEESSGVIDVTDILGTSTQNAYLLDVQAHYATDAELVEGGQLVLMRADKNLGPEALTGTTGNNTIVGGFGNDTINGGDGADRLDGQGNDDTVNGEAGNDTLVGGSGGVNQLNGGEGIDTVDFSATTAELKVDMRPAPGVAYVGGVLTDNLTSVESVVAGSGNSEVIGSSENNVLTGGAGRDVLFGRGGDDVLFGGAAPAGQYNQLFGDAGSDAASYAGSASRIYAEVATGGYVVNGGSYVLTDTYNSIENLIGGTLDDVLVGGTTANRLTGGAGSDQLYGRTGGDTFVYASASDSSIAAGYDTIADFATGQDKVDLSAFGINASRVLIASSATSTALYADTNLATPGFELAVSFIGANAVATGDLIF